MNIEKIREALEECRNQIEVPGTTYPKVVAAIAELDKAQPGKVDKLIEAGDAIASEVEGRQSIERMMSEQFDLSKDARESHAIRAERMRRRLAAWTSAKSITAQTAKVLTDEAVKDEAVKRYGPALYKPGDPRHDMQSVIVFYSCYEWLRDNGYLAPAPVDIERIVGVVDVWMREADENGNYFTRNHLRERLANTLTPKKP